MSQDGEQEKVYSEQEVAGKGVGCVAARRVKKGSLLLREKPVFEIEVEDGESTQAMMKQFVMLTKEDKEKYLGLYNAYNCDTSEWSTKMRSVHKSVMSGTADMTFPDISQEKATRVWEIMHKTLSTTEST